MPHRCSAAAWKCLDSRSELRSDAQTRALCHLPLHLLLHIFERDAGGFGEHEQDHEELDHGHHGEEDERGGAGQVGHQREGEGDDGVHDPVGEAAEALALGADQVGKHFAEVDPDDGALREGEETDEADEQPDQELLALSGGKDDGHTGQTNGGAGHHYPKKRFPFAEVEKFDRVRGLLGEITNPEGADALRTNIEEELLRNEHFVWQKFLLLITEHLTDEFWTIPDELYPHNSAIPPIPRGDLKWCLRRIYDGQIG